MTPYAEALDGKVDALKTVARFAALPSTRDATTADTESRRTIDQLLRASITRAESYWVDGDIWQTVLDSSPGLPLDFALSDVAPLDPLIPSPCGWIWLRHPWVIPHGTLHRTTAFYRTSAVSEAATAILWGGGLAEEPGRVRLFIRTFHRALSGPWRGSLVPLHASVHLLGRSLAEETEALRRELHDTGAEDAEQVFLAAEAIRRALFAFFLWVKQTILVAHAQPLERHAAKRLARVDMENTSLRVIALRRAAREPSGSHSGEPIERDHRWLVRGFWRMQYYPSTRRHEPIYILPYVKGPEDKPFKPSAKTVHAVIR